MANGKKIFLWGCLGCGGFLGLLILLLVGGTGFFAYKAVQFGTEITQKYATLTQDYDQLDQQFAFTPPEDQQMTDERLKEYLKIRSAAVAFSKEMNDKIGQIGDDIGNTFDQGGIGSFFSGAGKIGEIAKTAAMMPAAIGNEQLKLLREAQMSPQEYVWYTKTILGTLEKAGANQSEAGQTIWDNYVTAFNEGHKAIRDMNINTGQMNFDANDISIDSLKQKTADVNFLEQNMALIEQNNEQFIQSGSAAMLDYFALYVKEILFDFSQQPGEPQTPQTVELQEQ